MDPVKINSPDNQPAAKPIPPVNLPQTPPQQTPSISPCPIQTADTISDKFPPSPFPYSNQTIAADLTESNVIGKAVIVTDNNLSVREKIPLMKISLLLIFIITGFSGSFLYFRFTSASPIKNTVLISQPTITITVQKPSNIASSAADSVNPFASSSAIYINPFAPTATPVYQNPFGQVSSTDSGANQTYQNPFENLK